MRGDPAAAKAAGPRPWASRLRAVTPSAHETASGGEALTGWQSGELAKGDGYWIGSMLSPARRALKLQLVSLHLVRLHGF
jgi:hypothetical protein